MASQLLWCHFFRYVKECVYVDSCFLFHEYFWWGFLNDGGLGFWSFF